ncbi:UDP-N-acetylmuramate--L-alanine ligase [Brevibacillus choshinensis]|uniref:UDP-N-acetylmuramate--L-alanine ligase n=1 Tax=Brevibacillus choshinensis TaxID=54911 RepID=UPI002E222593|nr:UDP-N-acetylmuramate--L-alanine ligase [Brevibacillus choshinensis]MED4585504.1 UDP-N-acetylmuramate--L-alanine ligase [Brevibacillus choshinensis]MED4754003.1 UDP-N-acetylmuramate--L-alanine ligase [Brevibacillus choshinensis]MED4779134.1 UDP-N-acetylmuramate--L-alanine ligase [Brevibacillus choshinensis]
MDQAQHVHFVGIGGYGMSAIARVLIDLGYKVTGSDVAMNDLAKKLEARGAAIQIGHSASHVEGADIIVYSTSIPKDNPEVIAAEEKGIPVMHRSQMLARILNERTGVAVAGAHGKTTTTSMISHVLEECGVDPTFIIGGELMNAGTNAKAGSSDYVIAEADESDGSFLEYRPMYEIVTSIEPDHLEHFDGDFNNLKQAYVKFLSHLKPGGKAILCIDDEHVRDVLPTVTEQVVTYAIEKPFLDSADYRALSIECGDRRSLCQVYHRDQLLGELALTVPGKHNIANALAAIIVCLDAGLSFEQVAAALTSFRGAKRRFQIIGEARDILVVDDYAHHPTEIIATLKGAKASGRRVIAVFQPQRYTRTYFLMDEFSRAFADADEVIITDIYSPAGEAKIEGVTSEVLVQKIRVNSHERAQYIPTKEQLQEQLYKDLQPGDLVLTMGAGDIWKSAFWLAEKFGK